MIVTGALFCALAVILGAFGAHALKNSLSATELSIWHTAVQYQMWHALGIILYEVCKKQFVLTSKVPSYFFIAGIVLFSGSLYALVLSKIKILGAITPLGGLSFIAGWILFVVKVWRKL